MVKVTCINKYRGKNGVITGYKLVDVNNKSYDMHPQQLKQFIKTGNIVVTNLKLTSDNRLVDIKNTAQQDKQFDNLTLAKSLVYIYTKLLGMGDNLSEEVDNLCYFANVQYDHYENLDKEPKYSEEKMVKALNVLFNKGDYSILNGYIDYFDESIDEICTSIIYQESWDIKKNNILKSLFTICKGSEYLSNIGKIPNEKYSTMQDILKEVYKIDLVACKLGNSIGHSFFRYLNHDIFSTNSNDTFTVGHVIREDNDEHGLGAYVIRATLNSDTKNKLLGKTPELTEIGYSIIFKSTNNKQKIQAEVFKYKRFTSDYSKQMELRTTNRVIELDRKNQVETLSRQIATELNSIAKHEIKTRYNI